MSRYKKKYNFLATDGDGRQSLFEGRPHFVMSENCKHRTIQDKKRFGMWIYSGTKSIQILKEKVEIPINPECEIVVLN